jgi:hypothetical protein
VVAPLLLLAACDPVAPTDIVRVDTASAPDSGDTGADTHTGDSGEIDTAEGDTATPDPDTLDRDLDGYTPLEGDCDDTMADVYPGAPDACDGLDQDCDGEPIPDHSCSAEWPVEEMWRWELTWEGTSRLQYAYAGAMSGGHAPDVILQGENEDGVLRVVTLSEGLLAGGTVTGNTWTDDSPTWGLGAIFSPADSAGDGLDDIWVTTDWRGGGPFGGLFLFPGTTETIPTDDVRVDRAAQAMWLDGGGVSIATDTVYLGGVGDMTGDGLAGVMLFTTASDGREQVSYLAGDPDLAGSHTFGELPRMFIEDAHACSMNCFAGDLDGDGLDELEFSFSDSENLGFIEGSAWVDFGVVNESWVELLPSGAGAGVTTLSPSRSQLTGGDVDGDGLTDLQVHGRDADGRGFMRLLSGGVPSGDVEAQTTTEILDVAAMGWVPDVDGDGGRDPVTTSGVVSSIALRGGGVFEKADLFMVKPWYPQGYSLCDVADLDGDGLPEWLMEGNRESTNELFIVRGFDIPWDDPSKW